MIAFGWRVLSGKAAAGSGPPRSRSASCSISALVTLLDEPTDARQLTDSLYAYASAAGLEIDLDPGRPAVGVHVPGGDRGLDR